MTAQTFKTGITYEMRFITDADLRPVWRCVKRTAKTVTFARAVGEETEKITRRIKTYEDGTEVVRYGNYSMSPYISAKNLG